MGDGLLHRREQTRAILWEQADQLRHQRFIAIQPLQQPGAVERGGEGLAETTASTAAKSAAGCGGFAT